jgi:Flp pilus assembly protein TadD
MNTVAMKIAVSTLAIGLTMIGCRSDSATFRAGSVSASRSDQQAARLAGQAQSVVQQGDAARALMLAERAVELAPHDAGYRMLLADLYLKNGRFRSAEATFSDVLALNPGSGRAALSLALSQIAQGNNAAALEQLERLSQTASAADLGLAYALAGQPQRAVEMLEPAARAAGATGRVRQNLALAYALAGDWQRARTVAAQDVSPAELSTRMQQWAAFAQPSAPYSQVASLLNVTPRPDPGQPVRLALAPAQEAVAYAEAAPVSAPEVAADPVAEAPAQYAEAPAAPVAQALVQASVQEVVQAVVETVAQPVVQDMVEPAPRPVRFASIEPVQIPASERQEEPVEPVASAEAERDIAVEAPSVPVRYAAAVQSLVRPEPAVIRVSAQVAPRRAAFERARPKVAARAPAPRPRSATSGRFVVQLGAFSTQQNAERAWAQAERRFGLRDSEPLTTTIDVGGRTLHRVSVAGFQDRAEASQLCSSIRSRGGSCFVRATAGDAPVRWASRSSRSRRA